MNAPRPCVVCRRPMELAPEGAEVCADCATKFRDAARRINQRVRAEFAILGASCRRAADAARKLGEVYREIAENEDLAAKLREEIDRREEDG